MRWNFLLVVSILLLVNSIAVVADSNIEITPINNQVAIGEFATFDLTIINNENKPQRYSIYSLQSGQGWNVDPHPLRDRIIELDARQRHTTTLRVQTLESLTPGIYHVPVSIESDLGERYSESMKIYLAPEKPLSYLPSISAILDMDEKLDPTDSVSIKLFLENKNPLDFKGLTIRIQSDMSEFRKEVTIDLPPLEKKTVEFAITPNPFQQPKDYTLFFVFEYGDQTVKVIEQKVEVIPLLPRFDLEVSDEVVYWKTFSQLEVTNNGNVLNTQKVRYPVSFWQSLFTRSDAELIKDGKQRYLVWEATLQPNESISFPFVTNYRLLLYLAAAITLLTTFYLYVRSSVFLTKKVLTTKSDSEGALSEIKVTIELLNKSHKKLKNISIVDLVPAIANVEKSLELGTLKPQEIKHTKKGTKVIWSLVELDSHEHRIITYKIRAKLNILGTFSLPRASVDYVTKRGKKMKAYSNIIRLG